jgi:protein-disulfide isomerase
MTDTDSTVDPEAGLTAADHMLGDALSSVTLIEYGDYECPFCVRTEPRTQRLIEISSNRLHFVFRHFPQVGMHAHAELAAESAEAAAAQGQFWAMHRRLFTQSHDLSLAGLTACAESIGLDMNRFGGEMADRIYTQRVQEHRRAAVQSCIRSVPTYVLNGRMIDVSDGFERLDQAVHAALADH